MFNNNNNRVIINKQMQLTATTTATTTKDTKNWVIKMNINFVNLVKIATF